MRSDKQRAIRLRQTGYSYSQITKKLHIPKSTLSGWFTDIKLSSEAREKIQQRGYKKAITALIKRNKNQTVLALERARKIQTQSATYVRNLSSRELLLVGAVLYWAEGYKRLVVRNGKERTHHAVSLTNSDPSLVRIFIKFLTEVCKIPFSKILISLRIFEHQNEQELITYWHTVTGIPFSNFGKVYRGISISSQRKRPFTRLPYGVAQILVQKTELFHRIMGYIEGIKKNV